MSTEEKHLDEILKGRFIKRVLTEAGEDIDRAQVKYMDAHGFESADWISGRDFVASESALVYSQLLKHRFVDMKIRTVNMDRRKKKAHPVHNRIVFGHYNDIIKQMHFGFTEAIKAEIRTLEL